MSTTAPARPAYEPSDSAEEIAEIMAEAARVDALFQSGAISTLIYLSAELPVPEAV